jgi:hypothetical protein
MLKPLARERMVNVIGKPVWISFQHKKLPKYCFQVTKHEKDPMGAQETIARSSASLRNDLLEAVMTNTASFKP